MTFDGLPGGNVSVTSPTTLSVEIPAHAPGYVDLLVTNPDGQFARLTHAFRYVAGPTLTAIDVSSGPVKGGTKVVLTGAELGKGVKVTFGTIDASSVVYEGATQLTVWTPSPEMVAAVPVWVAPPSIS